MHASMHVSWHVASTYPLHFAAAVLSTDFHKAVVCAGKFADTSGANSPLILRIIDGGRAGRVTWQNVVTVIRRRVIDIVGVNEKIPDLLFGKQKTFAYISGVELLRLVASCRDDMNIGNGGTIFGNRDDLAAAAAQQGRDNQCCHQPHEY